MLKHKQALKFVVLVVVLALLSVTYLLVGNKDESKEKKDSSIDKKNIALAEGLKDSDIKKVVFTSKTSKNECSYERKKDEWIDNDHKDWDINKSLIDSMVSGFVGLTANGTIETKEDKKEYGFDDATVKFKFVTDKKEYKGSVGMAIPTSENYYCMIDGDDTLYSIPSSFVDLFKYTSKQLVSVKELENVDTNNIYYSYLKYEKGKELELEYDGDLAKSADDGKWRILKGYDKEIDGDHNGAKKFFSTFNAMTIKEFVDGDKDNWEKYGLDEPKYTLKFKYFTKENDSKEDKDDKDDKKDKKEKVKNHSVEIYFGDKKELELKGDGTKEEYYYVRTNGSDNTYVVLASDVDAFIKPDVFECVDKNVNNDDLLNYKDMVVEKGDDKYELSETSKKEKVKDGDKEKEETKYHYKFNDKDVAKTESAAALYNDFMQLAVEKEIKKDVDDDKVVAKITYHAKDDKDDIVVKFLPYDDNFYRVNKNGVEYFIISKSSVDKALDNIKNFDPDKK